MHTMKREYKHSYQETDSHGNVFMRVTPRHPDIGKYVVAVTKFGESQRMYRIAVEYNKRIARREGKKQLGTKLFKAIRKDGNYMVVRKLEPTDQLCFIDKTLLEWQDVKC